MNTQARVREIIARSKAGEGVIHWNPNKFLQLQPDFDIHLNMWGNPYENHGAGFSPAHTHDYGFTSNVVFGHVLNVRMRVAPAHLDAAKLVKRQANVFRKYEIIDQFGDNSYDEFRPTEELCTITRSWVDEFVAGESYEMEPTEWHASISIVPSITLLDMWKHAPVPYYTLGPLNVADAYETSDRRVKPEQLPFVWQYVEAMCQRAGL